MQFEASSWLVGLPACLDRWIHDDMSALDLYMGFYDNRVGKLVSFQDYLHVTSFLIYSYCSIIVLYNLNLIDSENLKIIVKKYKKL